MFKKGHKIVYFLPIFPISHHLNISQLSNFATILGKIVVLPPGFDLGNPGLLGQHLIHCSITSLLKNLNQLVKFDDKYRIQS